MIVALLRPVLAIVVVAVLCRLAWWAFGDFVLEHVGVPFLDSSPRTRSSG